MMGDRIPVNDEREDKDPWYLLQFRYMDGFQRPMIVDGRELRSEIGHNIEHCHYSGDGMDIVHIAQFHDGQLIPLELVSTGEDREMEDWLYWNYDIRRKDNGEAVMQMTVRIDGRA